MVLRDAIFLGKTISPVRQKGVPPLLLPACMLQLPRCLVRICNLFHKNNQIANGTVFINAIAAGITILKNKFASQMWAARPHLGSIFEKLLHQKTFQFACGSLLADSMVKLSCSCHVSCETMCEWFLEMPYS